jgi:hypothetical protein
MQKPRFVYKKYISQILSFCYLSLYFALRNRRTVLPEITIMNPTILLAALVIIITIITLVIAYYIFDPFAESRQQKRKARELASITEKLKKGMTLDEIESRYGYFDNYEISSNSGSTTHICYIGEDDSPYITLVFTNNLLNSWKLVV